MLPDRVSNPVPLTYELGALPIALRGPAKKGKSGGVDNIPAELVQAGGETMIDVLTYLPLLTSQVPYRLRYAAWPQST